MTPRGLGPLEWIESSYHQGSVVCGNYIYMYLSTLSNIRAIGGLERMNSRARKDLMLEVVGPFRCNPFSLISNSLKNRIGSFFHILLLSGANEFLMDRIILFTSPEF